MFHLIHSYNTIFKYAIFPNTVFNGGVAYFHKKRGATNAASLCLTISIMSFSFRQENVVFRNHFRKSSYSFHWRNKKTNFEGTYKNKEKKFFLSPDDPQSFVLIHINVLITKIFFVMLRGHLDIFSVYILQPK